MNPFADRIVPDPEARPQITVNSFNREIFETLSGRIRDGVAAGTNHCRASVLLSVNPGYGKTHLLSRVIDAASADCLTIFIPPINEGLRLARGVNHRVVSRLWRMSEGGHAINQFEWLALQMIGQGSRKNPEAARGWATFPVGQLDKPETQAYLSEQRKDLLKVLHLAMAPLDLREPPLAWASALMDVLSSDLMVETRATEWIKGRLLHYPGIYNESDEDTEPAEPSDEAQRAEARLFDILKLFSGCRPVLFLFDQVENFASFGNEALQVLFQLIERIMVESPATQILVAANGADWENFVLRSGVPTGLAHRFHAPLSMRSLSLAEARELRDLRAGVDKIDDARRKIPDDWIVQRLNPGADGVAREAGSPRRFLELCAARWDGHESVDARQPDFEKEFQKAQLLVQREAFGFYPDALRTFLKEVLGAVVHFEGGYEFWKLGKRVYFAEPGVHFRRWEAWGMRAGALTEPKSITALRPGARLAGVEHLAHTVVPKPTWKNIPKLKALLDGGMLIREIDAAEMVQILGVCRFLDAAVDMGVTREQAATWLKTRHKGNWKSFFQQNTVVPGTGDGMGPQSGIVQLSVTKLVEMLVRKTGSLKAGDVLPMRERGILFHELACRFVQSLIESKSLDVSPVTALREFLERERLWSNVRAHDSAEPKLEDSLVAFAERISALKNAAGALKSWQELYVATELQVHQVLGTYEGVVVLLTGRCDVLRRRRPGGPPEIVDYKLSSVGGNAVENQLQLALYAKLLSEGANPMVCHGTLEIYSPGFAEVHFTHERLLEYFQTEIEPALRRMVNQARANDPATKQITLEMGRSLSIGASEQPGSVPPASSPPAPEDLSRKIEDAFQAFKIAVKVISRQEAPQLVRYQVTPAPGVKVASLENRGEDLQVALGLSSPPSISPGAGYVRMDIGKPSPDPVLWTDVMKSPEMTEARSPMVFPIGVTVEGTLLTADFCDSNMAHLLVAGASGSGKSEFLKSLVATLLKRSRPESLSLTLVDPKVLTFSALAGSHRLSGPIITDPAEAMDCLGDAVAEMDRRYGILAGEGFENLAQRIMAGRVDIPFRVIVFDEFADQILASREQKKDFENVVARLAGKGRASGIHLVLATQRPDREIVTGLIKANLPLKVCLRVVNAINSQLVLDSPGAEALLGRGDLFADFGQGLVRAQSPYLTREELLALR